MIESNDTMLHVFDYLKNKKQTYVIAIITIKNTTKLVTYTMHPKENHVLVAFYLYKDDKKIDTQWYSPNFTYKLDKIKYGKGKFRIGYFVIHDNNESNLSQAKKILFGYSTYVYIN